MSNDAVITNPHARMHVIYGRFQYNMKTMLSQAEMAARVGDDQALVKSIEVMMNTLMTLATDLKQEWER